MNRNHKTVTSYGYEACIVRLSSKRKDENTDYVAAKMNRHRDRDAILLIPVYPD